VFLVNVRICVSPNVVFSELELDTVGYRGFFPKTKLKILKASTHTAPMRCTSMGCTPSEVHAYEVYANEIHVQ
jgi:hypothetical protein